ncbi:MAG: dienelactone hydrolase family protein [Ilumatobacteraceae bacterium]
MAHIVLFHHALGLTPGIESFAARLREAGHRVTAPDLFDGRRFESLDDGVAHAESIGFDTVIGRGVGAADDLGGPLVTMGFSLGVLPAQKLAQTDERVVGAVLCHAAVPIGMFGDAWPDDVGVQLHLVENDPWAAEDIDAAREVASAAGGTLYLYPGTAHLVAEESHDDHDPAISDQIASHALAFVESLGVSATD